MPKVILSNTAELEKGIPYLPKRSSPSTPKRTMAHLRAQARRFAFGESTDSLSSVNTGQYSNTSTPSLFSNPGMVRQSSNISQLSCDCNSGLDKAANIIPRRTGHIDTLTRDRPVKDFINALQNDGCVIIKQFVNPQISQRVHTAHDQPTEDDDTTGPVDVSSFIRDSFESDPLFDAISAYFLSLETVSWEDKHAHTNITRHHVYNSKTQAAKQLPASAPFLRADSTLHVRHHAVNRYFDNNVSRDALVGLLVPDTPSRSGARSCPVNIQAIPGSQLWNDQKPDVSRGIVTVNPQEGDALILLGSLYYSVASGRRAQQQTSVEESSQTPKQVHDANANLLHEVWTTSGIYRSI